MTLSRIYFVLLLVVAGGLTVRGCAMEQHQPQSFAAPLQYCTGLVLCGIALLIDVSGKKQ